MVEDDVNSTLNVLVRSFVVIFFGRWVRSGKKDLSFLADDMLAFEFEDEVVNKLHRKRVGGKLIV